MEFVVTSLLIGVGATVVMDLWALLQRRAFGAASLDYALVGRWVGHFPRGRFVHPRIVEAPPVRGERALGWFVHYASGVAFAALLLAVFGLEWSQRPTLGPALLIGVATILVPFLVMQPAFGAGVAASRTPDPTTARLRSLVTHFVFGLGLYVTATLMSAF